MMRSEAPGRTPTSRGGQGTLGGRPVRVQKLLSRAGVASRRQAERLVRAGRVRINGRVSTTPGVKVVPGRDRVEVDGKPVVVPPARWILLNKPPGTLTTTHDPRGRPTVYELLPPEVKDLGLSYLGRLDRDTEGLLLLSNEGDVMHRLLHPSSEVEREYDVGVAGVPGPGVLKRLEAGVRLSDGPARARTAHLLREDGGSGVLRLVLTEGRKREVRRMCAAVGHRVRSLRRVRFGPVRLGDLASGAWRDLTGDEMDRLRERAGHA